MDDPPLARANNIELIRDVLAIMFQHCLPFILRTIEKPNFLPDFFFFFLNDRLPGVRHLPADVHRCAWRSFDKMRDIPKKCYRIVTTKREIKLERRRELRDLEMKRRSASRR